MDVCGRVAVIFKILPVLVSFHSSACCARRKHPSRRKKSANKTSTVRPSCGGWHRTGFLSASLCRVCTPPPEKPGFPLSSPPPPPVFQPLVFCGVEGFSPPPLSLIFLSFTWTMAPGKRNSWQPAFLLVLYLQQPNKTEKRKPHRLSPWVVRLFVVLCGFWGEMVVVVLDLSKVPEDLGEDGASCHQLLSLLRAATPAAGWGVCGAMASHGSSLCSHPAVPRI